MARRVQLPRKNANPRLPESVLTMRQVAMKMPQRYTITQATADHVPLLAAIEMAAAAIFPPGSIPDHIRSDSVPVETLLEAVHEGLLWVAVADDGKPVGHALAQWAESAVLLAQMDVHPDHMRKGIGSALVARVAEHVRLHGKPALFLTTFAHIPWNAPFYAKLGFVAINDADAPPFLKVILENEKRYGLTNRIAMRLDSHP